MLERLRSAAWAMQAVCALGRGDMKPSSAWRNGSGLASSDGRACENLTAGGSIVSGSAADVRPSISA